MGVPEHEFGNVLRGNVVHVYGRLSDPDNGEQFSVGIATIQIKSTGLEYCITVNDVPYNRFFDELRQEETRIAEVAAQNDIIAKLWEENKKLKRLLGKTWRSEK